MKKSGKDSGKGSDSKNAASSSRSSASSGLPDPASLLDPASLFAYWGRDPTAAAAAAAASSNLFGSPFAGSLGLLPNVSTASTSNDRSFPSHPNTMAAAASQAASLAGMHPASWWSMAQYAAQDYFARLSGLPQLPFTQPDFGSGFPGVGNVPGVSPSTSRENASTSSSGGSGKKKKNGNSGNSGRDGSSGGGGGGGGSGGGSSNKRDSRDSRESTPSSYSKSSTPHPPPSSTPHTSPFDYKSLYSRNATNLQKELMAMTAAATALGPSPSTPPKNFSPSSPYLPAAQSTSSSKSNSGSSRDRGGDRDTPLSSKHHHHQQQQQQQQHHHHPSPSLNSHSISISPAPSSASSSHSTHEKRSSSSTSSSARTSKDQHKPSGNNAAVAAAAAAAAAAAVAANNEINFDSSLSISALSSLSQLGNLSNLTSQQSVTAAMNALAASSTKAKDYMSSGILSAALEGRYEDISDPSSFLGVRLPPDTEIIKYTSSIVGPKVPGTTNRGRKKTISLDPNPWVHGAKRPRLDPDFSNLPNAHQNDRIEVIKLPASAQSNGVMNLSKTAAKDTSKDPTMEWGGLGLIGQKQTTSTTAMTDEDDTPLNLSMKPAPPKSESMSSNSSHFSSSSPVPLNSNSLQSLTSITAAVGNSDSRSSKEGRPRNLGRGVSKPKKNTVASLLAQSRAVGIKPMLTAQQLMNPVELEKLRQAISESTGINPADLSNTDTESMAESGMSESEGEEQINLAELRVPLAQGWKRETIIHGLTKNGQIKGDVYYLAPGSQTKLKSLNQIKEVLIALSMPLKPENFSFSPRAIVGNFLQPAPPTYATDGEYLRMTDVDVASRLEELKLFTRHPALGVEQRIEIARHQQALREAKKMAKEESAKNKEKSKLAKELERNERLEQQRKEKELKHQQQLEARKKREEELAKQKLEEAQRKQQEKELKKQQQMFLKEQERERRRQHSTYMKSLDSRKKYEEREKKKHQVVLDKLISREKKLISRRRDAEILNELRKPQEDSEIPNQKDFPTLPRLAGLKLAGQALSDLLMVFEFLHTFGETLGFDMDSLPSLQSLHQALVSENAVEAEDELLSVITHLIVCAIEDPGIPNPNRHTTLLGQTLRQADITHSNVSEILRIYLYAISTSEVRQLTGYTYEKERRGQELDPEMAAKNQQFLDALHENTRYKLSECLKDKPFVALNPTVKAQILATLCNDLLLNKAVCKQIETSLETQASLKKEKYVIDAKIRKCKLLLTRKTRLESYERAIAQVGVHETELVSLTTVPNEEKREEKPEEKAPETPTKDEEKPEEEPKQESETVDSDGKEKEELPLPPPETPEKVNERDAPTPAGSVASEKQQQQQQQQPNKTNNDTLHEHDEQSDVESDDGTQMEEDEDASLMVDEIQKNLEELLQEASKNKESLQSSLHQLRAKCYGQDRYWRRYWHLPKAGGIFVEALESAQPEIAKYHEILDETKQTADALLAQQLEAEKRNKKKRNKAKSECDTKSDSDTHTDGNLSDGVIQHTNKDNNSLVEEKFVQPTPNTSSNDEEMDIEESIPTAILVQKNNQAGEAVEPMMNFNVPKVIQDAVAPPPPEVIKAEPEETNCDNVKVELGAVKEEIQAAVTNDDSDHVELVKEEKPLMDKWFSLIRRDIPLISSETIINQETRRLFCNITCRDQVVGQGHRWEVGNNLYFYTSPEEIKPDANYMISDSIMSLSGLNETEITNVIENITIPKPEVEEVLVKPKGEPKDEGIPGFSLPPYMALSLNNLTNYLQCDSPGPVMATPEEAKQLEDIKLNGAPTKLENNFVAKDLRHGWWKISEIEQLNEVIQALNPRAIRERNLRQNILVALTESIDLTIPCPVANPRAPPPSKGYIDAEPMNAWNPQIARRVELALLDQVESFEDKIASASMQVKGWNVPQRENDNDENSGDFINIQSIGERILNLEGAIERRYLKPPLGMNTTEAQLVLAQQKKEQELKEKEKQKEEEANSSNNSNYDPEDNIPRGLAQWRDAVERSVTCAQLSMALYVLESCVAWDKSIMKANCQFCQSGENEDKLLLCDGCDRGYHTYCFKPRMDKIPEGDWYCFECLNKATGERKCIVCGGLRAAPVGKMVYCDLCPRTYHSDCYIPPLLKVPRGKWYCQNCIGKAPPKKRSAKKRDRESTDASNVTDTMGKDTETTPAAPVVKEKKKKKEKKDKENLNNSVSSLVNNETPLSPSTTTTLPEDSQTINSTVNNQSTHEENTRCSTPINTEQPSTIENVNDSPAIAATSTPIAAAAKPVVPDDVMDGSTAQEMSHETSSDHAAGDTNNDSVAITTTPNATMSAKEKAKKERKATKKLMKELAVCKTVLDEMELHEDSWPFLLPVNTKQFPTYKKIIKCPMDLSTIKKRLQDLVYKSRDDFIIDVRTIFNNCEVFNEDDSPVGKAGHGMRNFFETRWTELTDKHS